MVFSQFRMLSAHPLVAISEKRAEIRGNRLTVKRLQQETNMRKIILTALVTSLVAASTVQMAAAAERHSHKAYRDFRGAYNQVIVPSQSERNIENFGFSGRDPSRIGGEDPSLKPSGS
jgi:hypothetical protein